MHTCVAISIIGIVFINSKEHATLSTFTQIQYYYVLEDNHALNCILLYLVY